MLSQSETNAIKNVFLSPEYVEIKFFETREIDKNPGGLTLGAQCVYTYTYNILEGKLKVKYSRFMSGTDGYKLLP